MPSWSQGRHAGDRQSPERDRSAGRAAEGRAGRRLEPQPRHRRRPREAGCAAGGGRRGKQRRQRRERALGGAGEGLASRHRCGARGDFRPHGAGREAGDWVAAGRRGERRSRRAHRPRRQDRGGARRAKDRNAVPADTAAAIAIIAETAEERLRAGEPLGPDVAALQHLGVDAAALAPLQAVAGGAAANAALAASFSAVAPRVLAAASRKETGSVADRFLAHLHSLVQVRDLNETAGDDPPALGVPDRGDEPARRHRGRARLFQQAPRGRASGGRRLAGAGPREAGGRRGAAFDPRGGDRTARGRCKTMRLGLPARRLAAMRLAFRAESPWFAC